jgi:hypothetical protein
LPMDFPLSQHVSRLALAFPRSLIGARNTRSNGRH